MSKGARGQAMTVEIFPRGTETGAASMLVSLDDGELVVRHGERGIVLLRGAIDEGFWNSLWRHIEANARITYRWTNDDG